MKVKYIGYLLGCSILMSACHDLDLNPLSNGSTENWYQDEVEVEMAVNELYRTMFWVQDGSEYTDWSDDYQNRGTLREFENATLNGQTAEVTDRWNNMYKLVSRANGVIERQEVAIKNGANATKIGILVGEAYFCRAHAYSELVFKWGDVPMVTGQISIEEGLTMGRTPKAEILKLIYDDFDKAAAVLPVTSSNDLSFVFLIQFLVFSNTFIFSEETVLFNNFIFGFTF